MKTKFKKYNFVCPKCGRPLKVTANYFFTIDGYINTYTGKIGEYHRSFILKSPCNDEFECPSCGVLNYSNGDENLNKKIFKLYQELDESTGTDEDKLPFQGEFDVIKTEHRKKFKNIIENFRRPKGRPYVFFEVESMDGECDTYCYNKFNYDEAREEQLNDIKDAVCHNLQLDIKNNRKITTQLVKKKLVEYRRYYIEEFDLERNSIKMEWLTYWCIQFLLTLREEDEKILY